MGIILNWFCVTLAAVSPAVQHQHKELKIEISATGCEGSRIQNENRRGKVSETDTRMDSTKGSFPQRYGLSVLLMTWQEFNHIWILLRTAIHSYLNKGFLCMYTKGSQSNIVLHLVSMLLHNILYQYTVYLVLIFKSIIYKFRVFIVIIRWIYYTKLIGWLDLINY